MKWLHEHDTGRRMSNPLRYLLDIYGMTAYARQLEFEARIGDAEWDLDQGKGRLSIGRHEFPVHVIGTYSETTQTWLWAWGNQSIDQKLASKSWALRDLGLYHAAEEFFGPDVPLSHFGDPALLALIAAGLLDEDAYFRCPFAGGQVFVLIQRARPANNALLPSLDQVVAVVERARTEAPVLASAIGIDHYVRSLGFGVVGTAPNFSISQGGSAVTFSFDRDGRLTGINPELTPGYELSPPDPPDWLFAAGLSVVIDALRDACPAFQVWEGEYCEDTVLDGEVQEYTWMGGFGRFVDVLVTQENMGPIPAIFAAVEAILAGGNPPDRDLIIAGFLESISHMPELRRFFGPETRKAWNSLAPLFDIEPA